MHVLLLFCTTVCFSSCLSVYLYLINYHISVGKNTPILAMVARIRKHLSRWSNNIWLSLQHLQMWRGFFSYAGMVMEDRQGLLLLERVNKILFLWENLTMLNFKLDWWMKTNINGILLTCKCILISQYWSDKYKAWFLLEFDCIWIFDYLVLEYLNAAVFEY